MASLSEPQQPFSMCEEGECSGKGACYEEETEEIAVAPKVEVSLWGWRTPNLDLLEKLKLIAGVPFEYSIIQEEKNIWSSSWSETEEIDLNSLWAKGKGWSSQDETLEETEEIGSTKLTVWVPFEHSFEEETAEIGSPLWEIEEIGLCSSSDKGKGWSSPKETKEIRSTVWLDKALWSRLSDDLLSKVIARLPLPDAFFRASSLSKQRRLTFCSASFQHEVNCSSTASWSSFCPLFVSRNRKALLGYENRSKQWCRLPSLSYLPLEAQNWTLIATCGSLLCLAYGWRDKPIFVTNPFTRSWRRLPLPPYQEDLPFLSSRIHHLHIVCEEGSKTYKVLTFTGDYDDHIIMIFDSTDGSWTMRQFSIEPVALKSVDFGTAFINGVFHKLVALDGDCYGRCLGRNSFDLKEKVWKGVSCLYQIFPENPKEPPLPFKIFEDEFKEECDERWSELFVCGSKVILIILDGDYDEQRLSVFELDLDNGYACKVSSAPIALWKRISSLERVSPLRRAVCHGDRIFIGENVPSVLWKLENCHFTFPSIVYNVATRQWSWWNPEEDRSDSNLMLQYYLTMWQWEPISYQPGLNPWLEP